MKKLPALLLALCPLAALAHGDLHERIDALTAKLSRDPHNAALYFQRGELHREHGEFSDALADFASAERVDPEHADVDFARGRTCAEAKDASGARAAFDRHLARHPDHAAALLLRARCLVALEDAERALADFDRGLALTPDPQPDDYLARAGALVALGRVDDALRGLDEAMARIGPAVPLVARAIEVEAGAGQFEAALRRLDQAGLRAPRRETWLEQRALILRRAGRDAEANAAAREALGLLDTLPASRRTTYTTGELEARLRALIAASP